MTAPAQQQIQIPPGFVVVTTYGSIRQETAQCLLEMRSESEKRGLAAVQYTMIPGTLVEKARNEAVRQMLKVGAGWLLFCDGDMTWQTDALHTLLVTAFHELPVADVLGAYCNLRGDLALPTMDTGTGTWESHYPGNGPVEVIRTGAAFLLVKRHVFEALSDPWFRMRVPARPVDFMAEVDNFARMKFDGRNPFRNSLGGEWERLEQCAREDPSSVKDAWVPVEVGEDSGFCDRCRNAGFRIFVQTNVVCGHVDTKIVTWADHKKAMDTIEATAKQAVGLWA